MSKRQTIILLGAIQLLFCLVLRANFLSDSDSYLYTYAALHFEPIGLAGGRWAFTAILGLVWKAVNLFRTLSPDSAWIVFSITILFFALTNVGLFFTLADRWLSRPATIIATALFVSSPLTGLYGSAVMTETPALTALLTCILLLSPRGDATVRERVSSHFFRVLLAGILFGLGAAMREPLFLLIPLPMLLIHDSRPLMRWSKTLSFILTVAAVFFLNLLIAHATSDNWKNISQRWSMGMSRERLQMVGWLPKMFITNIVCLICWVAIFSPVLLLTVPEQIRVFFRRPSRWTTPLLLAVALYGLGQVSNHTLVFNPRFAIFPAALLCIPAALGIWRKIPPKYQYPWLIAGILIVLHASALALLWPVAQGYYFDKSIAAKETFDTLTHAPKGALFVPGQLTPVVEFYDKLHKKNWRIIYAGWDFSDKELFQEIEKSRQTRRPVFIVDSPYWAEKRFRPTQYHAIETVWQKYPHHPSHIAHFSELYLSPVQTPKEYFNKFLNFLFSCRDFHSESES